MYSGISHIISPLSAAWCGWTMLFLFLCAILSEYLQPGIISQSGSSLIVRTERTYKDAPTNLLGQTLVTIFRIGTLAMALCFCFYPLGTFGFATYAAVCGLIIAVLLVKMVCNIILDYTFMLSRRFAAVYEHYANISTIAVCILYPALLVVLRIDNPVVGQWLLGIVTALFVIMWTYRAIRTFIISPISILYLTLYICTLELLPLAMLLYLSQKTISAI